MLGLDAGWTAEGWLGGAEELVGIGCWSHEAWNGEETPHRREDRAQAPGSGPYCRPGHPPSPWQLPREEVLHTQEHTPGPVLGLAFSSPGPATFGPLADLAPAMGIIQPLCRLLPGVTPSALCPLPPHE